VAAAVVVVVGWQQRWQGWGGSGGGGGSGVAAAAVVVMGGNTQSQHKMLLHKLGVPLNQPRPARFDRMFTVSHVQPPRRHSVQNR
jgi:hypothetical protein